ncbi:MAG: RNA polymerase sigma factor [Alloprevotella sp.]|nr:RNA polymerase sigma factor [Alloprevotella sp.]
MTREQFAYNVEVCQGALRRFLTALCCGDGGLADDLAQEAFLKAYLSLDTLTEPDKFKAWVFRIGYNLFVNSRRAEKHMESYDSAIGCEASTGADDAFRYQALYAALDRLPPRERTSVLLFYMEGYSTREIADITSTAEGTVRQHLSRGRAHLRQLMSDHT